MRTILLRKSDIFLQKIPELTKKEQSILARRIVSQHIDSRAIKSYKVNKHYWSASYTSGMMAVIISKNKVGIDIEKIIKRDRELFKISSEIKDWRSFYRIWTGKEAIIKSFNLTLKDYEKIIYQKHNKNHSFFLYNKKSIELKTIEYENYFISICYRKI